MVQTVLARALRVSDATVSKYVAAGMPSVDVPTANAWLEVNRKKRGRPRGYSPVQARASKAAAVSPPAHPAAAVVPQEAAVAASVSTSGSSTADLLRRLESVERQAFELLAASRSKGDAFLDRECVRAHKDATANLLSARSGWLEQMERERVLVSGDWVRDAMARHDGVIVALARAMPRALAPRISPHDPDHAEAELRRWVEETFLATLFGTNPFSNGNGSSHPEQPAG